MPQSPQIPGYSMTWPVRKYLLLAAAGWWTSANSTITMAMLMTLTTILETVSVDKRQKWWNWQGTGLRSNVSSFCSFVCKYNAYISSVGAAFQIFCSKFCNSRIKTQKMRKVTQHQKLQFHPQNENQVTTRGEIISIFCIKRSMIHKMNTRRNRKWNEMES